MFVPFCKGCYPRMCIQLYIFGCYYVYMLIPECLPFSTQFDLWKINLQAPMLRCALLVGRAGVCIVLYPKLERMVRRHFPSGYTST